MIPVEVAYAKPQNQLILLIQVAKGTTVEQAIRASGILARFPEIDLITHDVGIFGKVCKLDRVVNAHDRVEIYRPLLCDPKEARRQRAAKNG